jgi:uncharacterized protein YeaO (DUF488 family)
VRLKGATCTAHGKTMLTLKSVKTRKIKLKRAYDKPAESDGYRILVDRIWPRGVSKEDLGIDVWLKEIAPSTSLRKWFGHDPEKWNEFKKRYFEELKQNKDLTDKIEEKMKHHIVTLVYSAKDQEHNNAIALKEYIETQ